MLPLLLDALMIAGGLILLYFGCEGLLKGCVALTLYYQMPRILISVVVIGFGTSMPEMAVSVDAALTGVPDISLGNVIGSNIANILLIVGAGAVLHPILTRTMRVGRDMVMVLLASAVLSVLAFFGSFTFLSGLLMLVLLAGYMVYAYLDGKKQGNHGGVPDEELDEELDTGNPLTLPKAWGYSIGGIAVLIGGAELLVSGAVSVARLWGVSESVIGLSLVAFGTSLPELATAIAASIKRCGDMIIGNILGSNIFNILFILGVTSLIKPLPVAVEILHFDLWIMLGATVLLGVLLWRGVCVGRVLGSLMLAAYILYIGWLYM